MQDLSLPITHPQQLSDYPLVLPTVKSTRAQVSLMLKLDDLRKGPALIAKTIDAVQQLYLLEVHTLQPTDYRIALPIGIPCCHHCLPQTAHCLLGLLVLPKAVVLVVGEDDVIDDLPSDLPLSLHVLQRMGISEFKTASETGCSRLLIPFCQHPPLFQQEGLGEEVLIRSVDQ